jgi:Protein of unknown function (DUF664)
VSTPRTRPPYIADERAQLLGWLELQRRLVHWKCEGLSEADAHRSLLSTSPLMTMAGIVSHLRWVEHGWFEAAFAQRPSLEPEPEDADLMVDDRPLAELLEEYSEQCTVSDAIIAAHSFDDAGSGPADTAEGATLRWMLLHMLEETARHVGHLDLMRELLDGETGYY